ncbi:hypothetical protein ABMA70_09915 [Halobacteriovorax sp. XZX-3]|uniref:hypothetical protein n=1 Tax=unclassified Halobacteriovorax TaxID=2639665 RepID=UPI000CD0D933|nr:hypothetical protein [Halobacteriovorax sp. DA5]POB13096.1 hypothetical protein C0Z22_11290 [Halobacteriovorax sp. DA5]
MKARFFYAFFSILLICMSFSSLALDTKIEISIDSENNVWSVGEIKDFKLTIYPINDIVDEDIKAHLLSRDFADIIKISKVNKQYFLAANPEYYIIEASGVLIATPKDSFPKIWDYRGMALGVTFSDISFQDTTIKQQDFFVFNKKLNENKSILDYSIYLLIVLMVLGLAIYGYLQFSKKRREHQNWQKRVLTFKSADTREKHELIYSEKDSFFELFENREAFKNYLNKVNEVQYKRAWTPEDDVAIVALHEKAKENIVVK